MNKFGINRIYAAFALFCCAVCYCVVNSNPYQNGLILGLVFALIPFGSTANGAKRWIRFPVFGGVQPADVSKLAVIVFL